MVLFSECGQLIPMKVYNLQRFPLEEARMLGKDEKAVFIQSDIRTGLNLCTKQAFIIPVESVSLWDVGKNTSTHFRFIAGALNIRQISKRSTYRFILFLCTQVSLFLGFDKEADVEKLDKGGNVMVINWE